jgi:hypothetical protein
MQTIISYTTELVFAGAIAVSDHSRTGKIGLQFFVNKDSIGVEVAGVCSALTYIKDAKSPRDIARNEMWVDKYVMPCYNATELKSMLNIA